MSWREGYDSRNMALELQARTLERIRFAARVPLSPEVAADIDVEVLADAATGMLMVGLTGFLLAEKLGHGEDVASARVPATWWDHWKADHAEAINRPWFRYWIWRLEPARYRTLTVEGAWTDYATFPRARYRLPDARLGPVYFRRELRAEAWWDDPPPNDPRRRPARDERDDERDDEQDQETP